MTQTLLRFTVRRRAPELIRPAKHMHRKLKLLSDVDDQEGFRFHTTMIQFYRRDPTMGGRDPVGEIRAALAKVLVFYYPYAGRLRELPGRKLVVDCTGEGVLFVEADADVKLEDFGDDLQPPFPLKELLYDFPGSHGILNSPLLLIQVTRLLCGGFVFCIRVNHTISDAQGIVQFMMAVGEMARGAPAPSVMPVWQRELLFARDPPCVTCAHNEYDEPQGTNSNETILSKLNEMVDEMVHRSFFFGPDEVSALRRFVSKNTNLQKCSTFELITACLWRCRAIALQPNPEDEMRIVFVVNVRTKVDPPIPIGYYGNALAHGVATTTARDLCNNPLAYALELVMKAKSKITNEYVRSLIDLTVTKGRPFMTFDGGYLVSDLRRAGFNEVDFGWGKAVYGGPAKGDVGDLPGFSSFYLHFANSKGESGILVPVSLQEQTMKKFIVELDKMLIV